uniref:RRN3 homolog, RNA polymerase I transcription factor n=1 Tax=Anolis carolinensis TaxID=28377 RepID=A0A803T5U8_ANOCA
MLSTDEFLRSPPRKTVRFGGSLTDILLKYEKGDSIDFDLLRHQLLDPDIKDDQIINWLHEFRSSVTHLTKDFEQLVTILLVSWLRRSPAVVEEYLAFLSNLVSAQTIYLRPCLAMIVSHFIPREFSGFMFMLDDLISADVPASFDICHRALQTIVKYVPLTPQFLMPVLVEKFPFINKSERTLQCYVHNMLRISGYIPVLRYDILELVIERILKMDVSIQSGGILCWEVLVGPDCFLSGISLFSECCSLFTMEKIQRRVTQWLIPIAERLDILMIVLFSYVKDVCHVNGKLDIGNTKDLYRDLVAVFDKLILPTHGSCHVQYIMFYLSSFKLGIAEAFVEHLWKKLQDPNTPTVIRQAAANYIGSFLARAKFIPVVTVKACLDLLVNWLHLYIDNQGSGSKAFCDVALHGSFYAACQAVFYVVIFRHKQILDGSLKKGLLFLQNLNFERIVMSQLNPLKICLPSIVNFFAALTRKYQIAFCDTIIERNRRQVLPVIRSSCGGDAVETATNPLDSFFPFDPYVLNRSKNIINPLYEFWEEQSTEALEDTTDVITEVSEEDDDFLKGETPQNEGMMGLAPGSFDSSLQNPEMGAGSPPAPSLPL